MFTGIESICHIKGHPRLIFQEDNLIPTKLFLQEDKNCLVLHIKNHFVILTWKIKIFNSFSCSLLSAINGSFGNNVIAKACLKRDKKVNFYKNSFNVNTGYDDNILIILVPVS